MPAFRLFYHFSFDQPRANSHEEQGSMGEIMGLRCYFDWELLRSTRSFEVLLARSDESIVDRLFGDCATTQDWRAHEITLTVSRLRLHWDDELRAPFVEVNDAQYGRRRELFLDKLQNEKRDTILFWTIRDSWTGKQVPAQYKMGQHGINATATVKRHGDNVSVEISGQNIDDVLRLFEEIGQAGHKPSRIRNANCSCQLLDGATES